MAAVLYERRGRLVVITLNRPERLNALDHGIVADLAEAWRRYEADDDAWIAILTGAGRSFCSGRDIKDRRERGDRRPRRRRRSKRQRRHRRQRHGRRK